jgi:hypothetical protein
MESQYSGQYDKRLLGMTTCKSGVRFKENNLAGECVEHKGPQRLDKDIEEHEAG